MSAGKHHAVRRFYEFGAFRLAPAERIFARNGERIPLTPKAFDTLVLLVENSGRMLTKEQLIQTLWPDSFVEENNLTQHISALRRALAEEPGEYIETVPKLGYRFVCRVREIPEDPSVALGACQSEVIVSRLTRTHIVLREEIEEEDNETEETAPVGGSSLHTITASRVDGAQRRLSRRWILVSAGLLVVIAAGAALLLEIRSRQNAEREAPATAVPNAPHKSVAVLGFRNLSERSEDAWLSGALTEMLATELASGLQLRVVSGEQMQRIKSDLKVEDGQALPRTALPQIRNRTGADLVVSGSYAEVGSGPQTQIRLDLQMQDAVSGEEIFSTAVSGRLEELFSLVARSGKELRANLGAPALTDTEEAQAQAALPSTPETTCLYLRGIPRLRRVAHPCFSSVQPRHWAPHP